LTTDIAQFANTGTATTAGINMGTASLSIGAIEVTSARTRALTIGNSSATAGTLTLNGATINTVANVILHNASNSNLTLQDNETGSGKTMTLALANSTANVILLDGSGNIVISDVIKSKTGSTPLTISGAGAGAVILSGTSNTYTGNITITGAELDVAADGSLGNSANTITVNGGRLSNVSGSPLTINAARSIYLGSTAGTSISAAGTGGNVTYNGVLQDLSSGGILVKQGKAILSLGGVSTYTGNTSINNGTIQLTTGSNRLPAGTAVSLGQSASSNLGTLDLNGNSQQIAGLNSISGTNASASKNTVTSSSAATLTLGGSGTYAYGDGTAANSGVITGAISLLQSGSGSQTLGDSNTYSGGTTVTNGTLSINNASGLGTGAVTISGGALNTGVNNVNTGAVTLSSGSLSINTTAIGSLTLASAQNFTMSGGIWNVTLGSSNTSDVIIGSGGATFGITGGTFTLGGTIGAGTYTLFSGFAASPAATGLTINGYDATSFSTAFSNGSLTLTALTNLYYTADGSTLGGTGNWTATGGTNWSLDATTVSGGVWDPNKTANFSGIAGTVTVAAGGVTANKGIGFNVDGYTVSGGSITLGAATQAGNSITTAAGTATIASDINAANGLSTAGNGTLVLSGNTTAAGGVAVLSGKLQIGAGGTTGTLSGDASLSSSTNLTFDRSDATTYSGNISGSGTVSSIGGNLGLSGNITGSVAFTNSGARTVTLSGTTVSTSGAINFTGGTLAFGDAGFGSGSVGLSNGGTLAFIGSTTPLTLTNTITVAPTGGAISVASGDSLILSTTPSVSGALTKSGPGNLTITPAFSPGSNALTVSGGNLILSQTSGNVTVAAATSLTGNLVLSGPVRLNVNAGGSVSGPGQLQIVTTGTGLSNLSGDAGGSISSPVVLNSTNTALTAGHWSGTTYIDDSFVTTIGATKGATTSQVGSLSISGIISGSSGVNIANDPAVGGGGGVLVLSASNAYTGNTTINAGTPNVSGTASIKLGVTNALPATTGIIVGTQSGLGNPILDLNGFNQQVAYLADSSTIPTGSFLTITNKSSSANSTLTLSGSTTPGTGFGGVIADGASHTVSLVKDGSYTQILSGANTFSGGIAVNGGELKLGSSGAINVNGANALSLSGSGKLSLNGNSASVSDLAGTGIDTGTTLQNGSATKNAILTVNKAAGTSTFNGTIQNGGAATLGLVKNGNSELDLGGANTYTGATTINSGTVTANNATALGTGSVTVTGGANLIAGAGVTIANNITLGTTAASVVQNFAGLSSGLPAGWSVYTGATSITLGSASTYTSTATSWTGASAAGFYNVAAATGLTSGASSAAQNAATDRALGLRPAGGSPFDPGAAAVYGLSTSGSTLTSMSLDLMMLDSQTRSNTYSIQYSIGTAGTSWTNFTPGTWSDPGTFGTTTLNFNNPGDMAAISNQLNVLIRVAALTPSTGSGSRDLVGLDNFTLNYAASTAGGTLGSLATSGTTTFGGNVTLNNSVAITAAAGGNVVFSGIIQDGSGANAVSKVGGGTAVLSGANTYAGGTTVNQGELKINNTAGSGTGSGSVLVNAGATLAGGFGTDTGASNATDLHNGVYDGGHVGIISGPVTIASGGILSPGNSVGTDTMGQLTVGTGSILNFEFNGTANDFTIVTSVNGLELDGDPGAGAGFNLYMENSTDPFDTPGTYHLINYNGTILGDNGIASLQVLNPQEGFTYTFHNNATLSDVDLTIGLTGAPLPEPTSLGLLGLGSLGLLARRKPRKS
jgi:autotransporter-associated beta strand protein